MPPQRALVLCLLIAVTALSGVVGIMWYDKQNNETADDGNLKEQIATLREENKDLKEELREVRNVFDKKLAAKDQQLAAKDQQLADKDQEIIKDLKDRVALQQQVNAKLPIVEKTVDAAKKQVTRLTENAGNQ